jgi:hypothetical protein
MGEDGGEIKQCALDVLNIERERELLLGMFLKEEPIFL